MENISQWTIQTLRQDKSLPTWLEERKFEWIPLVKNTLTRLFSGESLIIITDKERDWFMQYITTSINRSSNRPYFPILSMKSILPQSQKLESGETEQMLIYDYLDNLFPQHYFFWYIGKDERSLSTLALSKEGSFLWIFDKNLQNNFTLQSTDPLLDIKLMQMYNIFNLTLNAAILGQISL